MKQDFASRYAAMSDEQLEYEASQSDGFAIDAREAMREEFEKRGLAYSDKLSAKHDGVQYSLVGKRRPLSSMLR